MANELTPEQVNARFADLAEVCGRGVGCQCGLHGAEGCRGRAFWQVEYHLLHKCNSPEANAVGNQVHLLCQECARSRWASTRMFVDRLLEVFRKVGVGVTPQCSTCQKPITGAKDLMRSKRLPEGIQR